MCHRVQTPHCMQVTQNYTVKYKISRQLPVLTRRLDHAGKMEYEIEDKIQHRKVQGVDGYRMFGMSYHHAKPKKILAFLYLAI